jgi:hypothetical protein
MTSFNDLLTGHQQLDELFFEHQRALIRGDLDTALNVPARSARRIASSRVCESGLRRCAGRVC